MLPSLPHSNKAAENSWPHLESAISLTKLALEIEVKARVLAYIRGAPLIPPDIGIGVGFDALQPLTRYNEPSWFESQQSSKSLIGSSVPTYHHRVDEWHTYVQSNKAKLRPIKKDLYFFFSPIGKENKRLYYTVLTISSPAFTGH